MNWQPEEEENQEQRRRRWHLLLLLVPLLGFICLAGTLFGQSFFNSRRAEFIPIDLHSLLAADYTANPNAPRIPGLRFDIIWDAILDRDPNAEDLEARKKALLNSLQTPVAVVTRPTCQGVHVIYATQDTWVSSADPTATHGRDTFLRVGRDQDQIQRIFLYFPLSDVIPPGSYISAAQLEMDLEAESGLPVPESIRFSSLASPFSELTTDWTNQPEPIFSYRTVHTLDPPPPDFHAWNVTDVVQDWLLSYYQNEGLVLEPQAPSGFNLSYFSREADSQTRLGVTGSPDRIGPRLIINCGQTPSPTPEGVAGVPSATPTPAVTESSPTPPLPAAPTTTSLPPPSPPASPTTPSPEPTLPSGTPGTAQPSPPAGSATATSTPGPPPPSPTPTDDDQEENPTSVPSGPTNTPVPVEADLSLTKSDSVDPVVAGTNLIYILQVVNNGPSTATGVTVVDTLPADVNLVSASPSQGNCTGATCQLGTLANGGTANITIEVTVDSATTGSLSNSANASANETDPVSGNNTATQSTGVNTSADLTVAKADSSDPVVSGGDLTYTLTVTNTGPNDATGITLSDTLPTEVTFDSASTGCTQAGGTVDCTIGALTAGSSGQVTITVTVNPAVVDGTVITNTATTGGDQTDPNTANNSATEPTTIDKVADLAIAKSDDPDPVVAGEALTYTLTITNNGPSTATNVVVTDTLPADVNYSSASPGCTNSGGTVVCTLASLAATVSTQFEINVDVNPDATSPLANDAEVASDTADTTNSNDSISETTTVNTVTDLAIAKSDNPDPVVAGETLTYTLTITNNGPSDAVNLVVTDTLPADVTFASASAGCTASGGTVTCNLTSLAAAASTQLTISGIVDPAAPNVITNNAEVGAGSTDPVTGNNTSSESTTVNVEADLVISKSDNPDPVAQNQALTYTLAITNNGPSDSTSLTITDTLPSDFIFDAASAGCTESGGIVSCNLSSLAVSASSQFTIAGTVSPLGISNTLTNVAEVDSTTVDPAAGNNSTTITTTISAGADLSVNKTVNNATPYLGDTITFTVSIDNGGAGQATNVTLADPLPAAFGYVSDSPTQGSYNSGTGEWDVGTLTNGQSVTLTLVTTATSSGVATNTAQISASDQFDPDSTPNNNIESEDDQDSAGVDVQLPALSINDVTVTEGDSGTVTATFSISLSTAIDVDVSVDYATSDNTAIQPADYQAVSGTLTFPAGTTVQTFTVQIEGDTLDETDETYTATLSGPINATLADATGVGTILDDDNPSLSIEDLSVTEGDSGITTAVFTVTLSAVGVQTATVDYGTANGTATTANSDYNAANGSITFSPGITQQTVTVDVVGDTTTEPDETFYVNLSSPGQATIADGQGVGTILNDDGTPVCSSPVTTLTAVADTYLRENQPGTNFDGSDLRTKPGPVGTERRALIRFDLSGLVPAGSSISCAAVTLYQPSTGPSAQSINIHRVTTGWTEAGVTWNSPWSTPGGDYEATIEASFVPTATSHVLNITSLTQFWLANPASNFGLLLDAEGADNAEVQFDSTDVGSNPPELAVEYVPGLVISDTTVLEGNSGTTTATITVTLTSSSTNAISVDYATADNTATTTDNDYVGGNGTLNFAPGETSKTFTVTINGDLKHEGDETFFVNLSSPTNAGIADGQGTVTILNDEVGGFMMLPGEDRRIFLPVIIKR